VPPFVLTVLKIVLLLLLYFFIYRAVRAIALDLYGRRGREPKRAREPKTKPIARRGKGAPKRVVVLDARGRKVGAHNLSGTLQVGRGTACEIRPDDTYLSQVHARISSRDGAWVVEDMGSTNGTFLNGRKVTVPTQVAPGDRVQVGKTILEFRR
jgi:hypothetical protein